MRRLLALLFLVATSSGASAHAVQQGGDAFVSGLLHPVSLPTHVLNLVALGLLFGQQDVRKAHFVPLLCLAVLSGLGATARVYVSPTEIWLPVSAGVLGVLLAGAWRLPRFLVAVITIVIGAMLGLDSRPETPLLSEALLMFAGTALAAVGLTTVAAIAASWLRRDWQRISLRVGGSWIAATAILVSALQFR